MKILDTYRNTQYTKDGPGLVLITDAMPEWNQKQWRDLMKAEGIEPEPKPWAPTFQLAFGFDSFSGAKWAMNPHWFADRSTADWIAQKYGTGVTREVDMLGVGPYSVDARMIEFQLADERWVNAGVIAAYYEANPIDTAPGVADKLIRGVLEKEATA